MKKEKTILNSNIYLISSLRDFGDELVANNFGSMSGMFFYTVRIDMFFCPIKFLFYNVFIRSFDW